MEISKLGKGRCILINDRPYRIIDTKAVVISKHSHTRTKLDLEDVFFLFEGLASDPGEVVTGSGIAVEALRMSGVVVQTHQRRAAVR